MDSEKSSVKKSWGGSRPGSGRKRVEHGRAYTFRSTPEVDALLSAYGGNRNTLINEAIRQYLTRH